MTGWQRLWWGVIIGVTGCARRATEAPRGVAIDVEIPSGTSPAPSLPPPLTARMWPDASRPVPANTAWLVVNFSRPVLRTGLEALELSAGEVQVAPHWVWSAADAEVTGAVLWGPFSDPRCSTGDDARLCEGESYALALAAEGSLLTFAVGPALALGPSWIGDGDLQVGDTAVRLTRATSDPCVVIGASLGIEGLPPEAVLDPAAGGLVEGLSPAHDYDWQVVCTNAAGFSSPTWEVAFRTLPEQRIRLTEVVVDPVHDWNDSQYAHGQPFDPFASPVDRTSPTDEWVELWNGAASSADIADYSVEVEDGTPSRVRVGAMVDARQAFPLSFGTTLESDARLVLRLSPTGQASNAATLVLRDALGLARDRISLGTGSVPSGAASSADDESVSICGDTEARIWRKTRATPAAANACP